MYYTTFFRCRQCFCKVVLAANYEPQATKSFLIQQFFKNAGEVWGSSPHLRSKSDFQIKLQQKSRRKSKESQLPFQSRGCNENTRFQGQLRFPGKLGICPALPTRTQLVFLRTSFQKNEPQATKKFFDAAILQKCCRGVGEQPTFAKQMKLYNEMKRKSRREPQIAIALKIERL